MKVHLIVLDSLGVGALPDAPYFGDSLEVNTLKHVFEYAESHNFSFETLINLGLRHLVQSGSENPQALIGRAREASNGKDTVIGHWEIAGVITNSAFPVFPNGFPDAVIEMIQSISGRGVIGNVCASGTEIVKELGETHLESGDLIVYTSADSVLQIAAHEEVIPPSDLYDICRLLRTRLMAPDVCVNRIIARPFVGNDAAHFVRTQNRKDFALEPPHTHLLNDLLREQIPVYAVGKISDIFPGVAFTDKVKISDNVDGMHTISQWSKEKEKGLIFANLVDFDMLYGHRRDVAGYAEALKIFDEWLHIFIAEMSPDDWLILTADHGCDPMAAGTDHTREYIPIVFYSKKMKQGRVIPDRTSYADISCTIANIFQLSHYSGQGQSFHNDIFNCMEAHI